MEQQEILVRLSAGEGFDGRPPERIDTHISVIFLAGDHAYKLKRALRTSYLDYRSLESRRHFCEQEVVVNRRTAPDIYLAAIPIRLTEAGRLVLSGAAGEIVDWLVHMRRFDQAALLDRIAARGALGRALTQQLGDVIAGFHQSALRVDDPGGDGRIASVLEENRAELERHADGILERGTMALLDDQCRDSFQSIADVLWRRGQAGYVRHCHGDLHLGNICVIDGRPVLFDAIEFNDAISHVDVLFDLAFLLMDLLHRDDAGGANRVFNRYLFRTLDYNELKILPLFIALRAGIRAHVSAMAASATAADDDAARRRRDCKGYARLALSSLERKKPVLVAVSGLSGTGKSSVAEEIAPALGPVPGAVILGSDMIRKRRLGVDLLARLGPDAYTTGIDDAVYGEMGEIASTVLSTGQAVVLDATFRQPRHRDAAEAISRRYGVAFAGIRLEADRQTLEERVRNRRDDVSDATPEVLHQQLEGRRDGTAWTEIDAARSLDSVSRDCREAIRFHLRDQ
jgi:aminoglycoside phosphotransferase family enzyme/predicted kinase